MRSHTLRSRRMSCLLVGIIPLTAGLLWLSAAWADEEPAHESTPHPRLVLPLTEINTGRQFAGPPLEVAFPIRNTGDAVLHIKDAQPDCGCVVASFDRLIEPGGVGRLQLSMRTDRIRGELEKHIRLLTDDPAQPSAVLTLQTSLVDVWSFDPGTEISIPIQPGALNVRELRITCRERTPLAITKIDSSAPFLRGRVVDFPPPPPPAARGESVATLAIVVTPEAPARAFEATLTLSTNSEHSPTLTVRVYGYPRDAIAVMPPRLRFDHLYSQSFAGDFREIALDRPAPFHVNNVTVDDEHLRTEINHDQSGQSWTVKVIYTGGWMAGPHTGVIHIETDDPVRPTIDLTYQTEVS
jgi:Protein of unknown function (DUF1573)